MNEEENEWNALLSLKIHEAIVIKTTIKGYYPIEWQVMRVPNGWIYTEENPRLQRAPISHFVPETTFRSTLI